MKHTTVERQNVPQPFSSPPRKQSLHVSRCIWHVTFVQETEHCNVASQRQWCQVVSHESFRYIYMAASVLQADTILKGWRDAGPAMLYRRVGGHFGLHSARPCHAWASACRAQGGFRTCTAIAGCSTTTVASRGWMHCGPSRTIYRFNWNPFGPHGTTETKAGSGQPVTFYKADGSPLKSSSPEL